MTQNAVAFRGNVAALKAVNSGEIEGAVIYHYYYFGDQARTGENTNNTALHYFRNRDPGAFVSVSGGGVLASSKHAAQAQAFLKWVTGKGGQGILRTGDSYEYAVGVGAGRRVMNGADGPRCAGWRLLQSWFHCSPCCRWLSLAGRRSGPDGAPPPH